MTLWIKFLFCTSCQSVCISAWYFIGAELHMGAEFVCLFAIRMIPNILQSSIYTKQVLSGLHVHVYKLQRDNHEPKCSAYCCAYYSTNRTKTTLFCCLQNLKISTVLHGARAALAYTCSRRTGTCNCASQRTWPQEHLRYANRIAIHTSPCTPCTPSTHLAMHSMHASPSTPRHQRLAIHASPSTSRHHVSPCVHVTTCNVAMCTHQPQP